MAPLLGELSRKRLRGRQGRGSGRREKIRQYKDYFCHSEVSDRRHWPWESASLFDGSMFQYGVKGYADSHVAPLLATAAYHDSLICRLVPLGAMTLFSLPCSFFSALLQSQLWRPLSPVCALGTSPKRGSKRRGFGRGASICASVQVAGLRDGTAAVPYGVG